MAHSPLATKVSGSQSIKAELARRPGRNDRAVIGLAGYAPHRSAQKRGAGGGLHTLRVFGPRVWSRVEPRPAPCPASSRGSGSAALRMMVQGRANIGLRTAC